MSENTNVVQLDIIPIYKNEMYPIKKKKYGILKMKILIIFQKMLYLNICTKK